MKTEKRLAEYICRAQFSDIPQTALTVIQNMLTGVFGTIIAGSNAEGCETLVQYYRDQGGKEEATILIHGGKVPAQNAVMVNSVMARALDFDDAMAPGIHIGASVVPAALGAAELAGGCSGKDFLTALALGTETAARLNLTEATYDGFDPTGVCSVFAAAAAAGRILRLNESEMWNALALAFNRSGGSFQCNIDGSLAVRVIQGWVSQTGMHCAQLAKLGITGPKNFLDGVYGYFHLFGRDAISPDTCVQGLGERFDLQKVIFKKYPSCGLTLGCTDVTLALVEDKGLAPDDIDRVEVRVPPYAHKLVGHPFEIGDNPKVNAQFSIQYCVANALMRKSSRLRHFEENTIKDHDILGFIEKISVTPDPALDARGHTALDLTVFMHSGEKYTEKMDIAPGFPGNPLLQKDHENHFWDCMDFSDVPFPTERAEELLKTIGQIEDMKDVRVLIPALVI